MRLLINASNLRFGGGKTVGMNIVDYYLNNHKVKSLILIAPSSCGYEIFKGKNKIKVILLHGIFNFSLLKIFTNYVVLPLISIISDYNFILSLGNVAFPSFKPQFVLIHQPFFAYPESIVWNRIKKEDRKFSLYITTMVKFIKINLKYAQYIGVQTETMKRRISDLYKISSSNIFVIPNSVSFTSIKSDYIPIGFNDFEHIKLLFLSKYYPHKNFEILFDVARKIKERNLPIRITVTIDEKENEGGKRFLDNIRQLDLDKYVINVGNIGLENIAKIYQEHHALFLPTLLESFSGTYIESMYFDRPIFTSNMDFALDVCRDAAFYFNPLDSENIIETVLMAFENKKILEEKVNLGRKNIINTKSWIDIGNFIDREILGI